MAKNIYIIHTQDLVKVKIEETIKGLKAELKRYQEWCKKNPNEELTASAYFSYIYINTLRSITEELTNVFEKQSSILKAIFSARSFNS